MKPVNIHTSETQRSQLPQPLAPRDTPRPLGLLAGTVTERDDCWATDPELDAQMYGGDAD